MHAWLLRVLLQTLMRCCWWVVVRLPKYGRLQQLPCCCSSWCYCNAFLALACAFNHLCMRLDSWVVVCLPGPLPALAAAATHVFTWAVLLSSLNVCTYACSWRQSVCQTYRIVRQLLVQCMSFCGVCTEAPPSHCCW